MSSPVVPPPSPQTHTRSQTRRTHSTVDNTCVLCVSECARDIKEWSKEAFHMREEEESGVTTTTTTHRRSDERKGNLNKGATVSAPFIIICIIIMNHIATHCCLDFLGERASRTELDHSDATFYRRRQRRDIRIGLNFILIRPFISLFFSFIRYCFTTADFLIPSFPALLCSACVSVQVKKRTRRFFWWLLLLPPQSARVSERERVKPLEW